MQVEITRPELWLVMLLLFAATWRVTHLFMWEVGPWKVLTRLRALTGVQHHEDLPIAYPDGNVFECFWCLSIWVSLVLSVVAFTVAWPLLVPLAASAVAIKVQLHNGKS